MEESSQKINILLRWILTIGAGITAFILGAIYSIRNVTDIAFLGQFGDFIGGVLNPLFALVNICITVYIAILIQKFTDLNNTQSLETSRQIALMQMKHDEVKEFKREMTNAFDRWEEDLNALKNINRIYDVWTEHLDKMNALFPELENSEVRRRFSQGLEDATMHFFKEGALNQEAVTMGYVDCRNYYSDIVGKLQHWVIS